MILNTKAAPPSSEWVQIWKLGVRDLGSIRDSFQYDGYFRYQVKIITAIFDYNVDMYLMLSTPRHVKRFWSANDQTNYRTAIRVVYDDNTTGIINVDGDTDFGASGDSYYNISIGGQKDPNTNQIYYVDMLFFKKAPEGDFKTWLENNCRRIV